MRYGGNSRGFTLAELLVVVAIIAVLVGISIPVMSSALEEAGEATCLANRSSAGRECTYALLTVPENADAAERQAIINGIMADYEGDRMCPKHGTYTPRCEAGKGWVVTVTCSEHNDGAVSYAAWVSGKSYAVGDLMTSGSLNFRCSRAHSSGNGTNTKEANKASWLVISTVDGTLPAYSSQYAYEPGVQVTYTDTVKKTTGIFERKNYLLSSSPQPYDGSAYWTYIGPAPAP